MDMILRVLSAIVFYLLPSIVFQCQEIDALFLPGCAKNISKTPAVCCPVPDGYKSACGYPFRGICRKSQSFKEPVIPHYSEQFKSDIRVHWPQRVFQYHCECIGRHWGQDCGECWYGYEGINCQYRTMQTRRRATKMNKSQRKFFVSVLAKASEEQSRFLVPTGIRNNTRIKGPWKSVNVVEYLTFLQWFASYQFLTKSPEKCNKSTLAKYAGFSNGQPNFLFFYRHLSLTWEKEMQKIGQKYFKNGNWSWPYFDWTDKKTCEVCTDDLVGSETGVFDPISNAYRISPKSPLHKWIAYCSDYNRSPCSPCSGSTKASYITRRWIGNNFPQSSQVRKVLQMPLLYNLSSLCYSFSHMLYSGKDCFCNSKELVFHRGVLSMLDGAAAQAFASTSDPFFMLHYANIDRLFARWFDRVLPSMYEIPTFHAQTLGGCRQCAIVPHVPPVTNEDMFSHTEALGYLYEDYDFGHVKLIEEISSPFNHFIAPKDLGCHVRNSVGRSKLAIVKELVNEVFGNLEEYKEDDV